MQKKRCCFRSFKLCYWIINGNHFFIIIIYTLLSFKNLSRLHVHTWTLGSFIYEIPNLNSPISCNNGKKTNKYSLMSFNQTKGFSSQKIKSGSVPHFLCGPSPFSLSSANLAQPVVCLGVGYDGLNSYDGLVDLGLKLPQLLNVQQAQDLSRFV